MKYVKWFEELSMKDVPLVGGKNASLGEMIRSLSKEGIAIPDGFAVTAEAYWLFLDHNELREPLEALMKKLDPKRVTTLKKVGAAIRKKIANGAMPPILEREILLAYKELSAEYNQKNCDVAVRSSATAEDLPTASFAGQQETFLNVHGPKALIESCKESMASLFTDRAIMYRIEKGFDHFDVALSVGIQKMIRSDKASAGVAFSCDTETGFKNVIMIDAAYGLGESVVKGIVNPDEYFVFKPTLEKGFFPIIKKKLGDKKVKIIYSKSAARPTKKIAVQKAQQQRFALTDDELLKLAQMVYKIDEYYSKKNKQWTPMDVEWAKDGDDKKIYIVQARPETIHAQKQGRSFSFYRLLSKPKKSELLATGLSIGTHIVSGPARVITSPQEMRKVKKGDIIVTQMTDPDWVPVMKKAGGIVTDLGGRTCHAAIVSRELGTPAIVGTNNATKKIKNGQKVTLDCSAGTAGYIYNGVLPFEQEEVDCTRVPKPKVPVYMNIANPGTAFALSSLPVDGVGLARVEFIISSVIKTHPMALLDYANIKDKRVKKEIQHITQGYKSPKEFFVDTLAQGVATIAAAFYPRPVIVRLSDFKSNEYENLVGGSLFEQKEANPMLGFRGASRYTHEQYKEAFCLESAALLKVRKKMGLENVMVMVPFVRTIEEAKRTIDVLAACGLERGKEGLKLVMMCELPSNVILIEQFARYFDGFSIGSNDLTQLTLGVDRDSAILAHMFDERDDAMKKMFEMAIDGAHKKKRFIGICGQAPSDYPELADFLIEKGIDSISLNPDTVLPFMLRKQKQ